MSRCLPALKMWKTHSSSRNEAHAQKSAKKKRQNLRVVLGIISLWFLSKRGSSPSGTEWDCVLGHASFKHLHGRKAVCDWQMFKLWNNLGADWSYKLKSIDWKYGHSGSFNHGFLYKTTRKFWCFFFADFCAWASFREEECGFHVLRAGKHRDMLYLKHFQRWEQTVKCEKS